ncbi:MAG: hypothetical protein LKF36_03740 [Lactobacillus sp.]|jgi:putative flippase GtrA|nr:hypothetical protein [Lactobacillus sp.]
MERKQLQQNRLVSVIKHYKVQHPSMYEFILFNIMGNVATVTNFIVLWLGTGLLFKGLSSISLHWFIFNYGLAQGGLGGFLSFLLAYMAAQIVNFIVQRKVVFGADVEIGKVMPWYIGTVIFVGLLSIWLPPYVIALVSPFAGSFAPTLANVFNICLQVAINYPMMKFKIMKKV